MISIPQTPSANALLPSNGTMCRRYFLWTFGATVAAGSVVNVLTNPNITLDPDKRKVVSFLEQTISELKKDDREKETVRLLRCFKSEFTKSGTVSKDLPIPIMTFFDYCEGCPRNKGTTTIHDVYTAANLNILNAYWNARSTTYLRKAFTSVCLKESIYFDEDKKEQFKQMAATSRDLEKRLKALPKEPSTKEEFMRLAGNPEMLEAAKHYLAQLIHWEYIGYKLQLEFLHRQGFDIKGREQMRQDKVWRYDPVLGGNFSSHLERMGFVSEKGEVDEGNLKLTIERELFNRMLNGSQSDALIRNAFFIVCGSSPKALFTNDFREILKSDVFNFVNEEKYWKVNIE